ncbi:hypothetical protein GCM10007086_24410 [Photobacterium aphoticum]|nr:hypothetical protein GCM10007086_24410 [Photobacterium aphoticum]
MAGISITVIVRHHHIQWQGNCVIAEVIQVIGQGQGVIAGWRHDHGQHRYTRAILFDKAVEGIAPDHFNLHRLAVTEQIIKSRLLGRKRNGRHGIAADIHVNLTIERGIEIGGFIGGNAAVGQQLRNRAIDTGGGDGNRRGQHIAIHILRLYR